MKIVLATGIYPPDIGGPATYVRALAEQLIQFDEEVVVVTYGDQSADEPWLVQTVGKQGGPFLRWWRYSRALRQAAADADIVYAFSSVSVGMPLWLAHLRRPKTVLRLGGDFGWERYTARGGTLSLRAWYESHPPTRWLMTLLLRQFDQLVFSTQFQQEIYQRHYSSLPPHQVIENALPAGAPQRHAVRQGEFRLLVLSRFVGFKNLESLVRAMAQLPEAVLTLVGSGPRQAALQRLAQTCGVEDRVAFSTPVAAEDRAKLFAMHDLLVIPSVTEISPNVALEARQAGLPVLLTTQTGLSEGLRSGMTLRILRTPDNIVTAVRGIQEQYDHIAEAAAAALPARDWEAVAREHQVFFRSLVS